MAYQKALDEFSPVKPLPFVFRPEERLQRLKKSLDEYCPCPEMLPNLRAVINAYETNAMPSSGTVYFKNGQMVSEEEGKKLDMMVWEEVRSSNS